MAFEVARVGASERVNFGHTAYHGAAKKEPQAGQAVIWRVVRIDRTR